MIRCEDAKGHRCKVSNVNTFLPLLGKNKRMGNNFKETKLIPIPSPSLIREGIQAFTLLPSLNEKRKAAFTLAEVLITLGIIGVVAALTIPSLIAKYQEQQLKAQFKKTYSTMAQALQFVVLDNGGDVACYRGNDDVTGGGVGTTECIALYKKLAEKMKYVKYCPSHSYDNGCIPEYKSYHSGACYGYSENDMNNFAFTYVLADGSLLISYGQGREAIFAVDINGKKGPNERGKDLFSFSILRSESGGYYFDKDIMYCLSNNDDEKIEFSDMYK